MKTWFKILFVALLGLSLMACGKKDKREGIPTRSDGRHQPGLPGSSGGSISQNANKGVISTDQPRLDLFIAARGRPEDHIGLINGSGTGVFFIGHAAVNSQAQQVRAASFEMEIVDDYALQYNQSYFVSSFRYENVGNITPGTNADSVQSATIEFVSRDSNNEIIQILYLRGSVTGNQTFEGTLEFQNLQQWSPQENRMVYLGQSSSRYLLGQFRIPACSFFDCK